MIKRNTPHRKPNPTFVEFIPWKLAFRETSRHHWYETNMIVINPIENGTLLKEWNHLTSPEVITKAPMPVANDQ